MNIVALMGIQLLLFQQKPASSQPHLKEHLTIYCKYTCKFKLSHDSKDKQYNVNKKLCPGALFKAFLNYHFIVHI